jgi:uncharacterized membrane protein (DUF4010 family)
VRYLADVFAELDWAAAQDFGTALLLGMVLGVEREKRIADDGHGIAGLRSFVLFAEAGAVAGYLAKVLAMPWIVPAVVIAVATVLLAGYLASARVSPKSLGLTTELAAIVTVLLGALATTGNRELAIGLGVCTAALLAYKQPLHGLVGKIGWGDVLVGLRFLLAAFLVLPLLPEEAIDPWGAIHPYKLWMLVLLISGLSLVGYIATRWLGPGHGTAITAASGGLVSSTAVTLALVKQSREPGADPRRLAGGILLAWGVMFGRVVVAAGIINPAMIEPLAAPFVAMLVACGVFALWAFRGAAVAPPPADGTEVALRNPFSLWAASKFALLFAGVSLLLQLAQHYLPGTGVYVVSALAGLTDVDAITLSMAEQARNGVQPLAVAAGATVVAALTNTFVKAAVAVGSGKGLAKSVAFGTVLVAVAGGAALALG